MAATDKEEVWVSKGAWKWIRKALMSSRAQGSSSEARQIRKIPEVGCKQKEKHNLDRIPLPNSGVGQLDIN